MSSDYFWPTMSQKHKNYQFTVTYEKEKWQIITTENQGVGDVWGVFYLLNKG